MRPLTPLLSLLLCLSTETIAAAESAPGYCTQWGAPGGGNGQFDSPYSVAIGPSGNVYVTDRDNERIQKFGPLGGYILQWGNPGSGDGQFNQPFGVAVDGSANVFVVEFGNNRVQKFNGMGTFLAKWGSSGSTNGKFISPEGVAVDAAGNVYVADTGNNRIQKFSGTGTYVLQWGTTGSGPGQFNGPVNLAVDTQNYVYVSDFDNDRIEKFTNTGTFVTQWGSAGSGNGQFNSPQGIAFDMFGDVWVADAGNNRIQHFTNTGAYVSQSSTGGESGGAFSAPVGLAASGHELYESEVGNNRIQMLGFPQEITNITDVGNDQGRQVRLRFEANGVDLAGSATPITGYALYRRVDPLRAATRVKSPAGAAALRPAAPAAPAAPTGIALDGWDYLLTVAATGDNAYDVVAPTLVDSGGTGSYESTFLLRALTAAPATYFECRADSGYSVDNLPPAVPSPFLGAVAGGSTHLHWDPNSEPDFWYYRLYRGSSPSFVPSSTTLIAAQADTGYVDPGPAGMTYKLSAVDVNGNESPFAVLTPSMIAGIEGSSLPRDLFLAAPVPNPARGRVTLAFGIPRDAVVALRIYDVEGRMVRSLASSSFSAGEHALAWDLRDAEGRPVHAGMFIARLESVADQREVRIVVVN